MDTHLWTRSNQEGGRRAGSSSEGSQTTSFRVILYIFAYIQLFAETMSFGLRLRERAIDAKIRKIRKMREAHCRYTPAHIETML